MNYAQITFDVFEEIVKQRTESVERMSAGHVSIVSRGLDGTDPS